MFNDENQSTELKFVVYSKFQGNTFTIGFDALEAAEAYAETVQNLIGIYRVEKIK